MCICFRRKIRVVICSDCQLVCMLSQTQSALQRQVSFQMGLLCCISFYYQVQLDMRNSVTLLPNRIIRLCPNSELKRHIEIQGLHSCKRMASLWDILGLHNIFTSGLGFIAVPITRICPFCKLSICQQRCQIITRLLRLHAFRLFTII